MDIGSVGTSYINNGVTNNNKANPKSDVTFDEVVSNTKNTQIPFHKMDQATFLEYQSNALKQGGNSVLTGINSITKAYCTGKPNATTFEDAFPRYSITAHVGNVDVTAANWQRNDFPFWKYYEEGTSADSLNDWTPSGPNPPLSDTNVQKGLNSIGAGRMAILIPDKLQEKMDADPEYAKEVMKKIQKWKEDYDNWDNAAALSLGMNVAEHQAMKSYCISLDEDGNVKQFTVSSPGRLTKSDDGYAEQRAVERKRKAEENRRLLEISIKRRKEWQHSIELSRKRRADMINITTSESRKTEY